MDPELCGPALPHACLPPKEVRGFTALSLRGLARAAGEYLLACLAHTLGTLLRVCPIPPARLAPAAV